MRKIKQIRFWIEGYEEVEKIVEELSLGFEYVKALAQGFFGITDVCMFKAEGLDIWGADVKKIMEQAKNEITG